jgi:hypothetical protein
LPDIMPALKVIRPEGLRDDYVLIKVDAPASARYATHSSKLTFTWLI